MKKGFFMFLLFACSVAVASSLMAGDIVGKVSTKSVKYRQNVVVYIERTEGDTTIYPAPKEHFTMDQKNLEFVPHVLPVLKGTTVDFQNSDGVLHNVFTPDKCAEKFNLGTWPQGEARSYTFKESGCMSVMLCNVHPEMEAWVVVLETPYFAVTDKEGNYKIEKVPEGKYKLTTWHEKKLAPVTQEVTVPGKGSVTVNFELMRKK